MTKINLVVKVLCMAISFIVALRLATSGQKELMGMACISIIFLPFVYSKTANIYRFVNFVKKNSSVRN